MTCRECAGNGMYRLTFGRHRDQTLRSVYDNDYIYLQWLGKQEELLRQYPEIAEYIFRQIGVPTCCAGTLDGMPCPRSVGATGYCWAHMRARDEGRSLDLTSCIAEKKDGNPCDWVAQPGKQYCHRHRGKELTPA